MINFRPTYAEINLAHLRQNAAVLKALNPGGWFCPMVKCDAYGHGAIEIVTQKNGKDGNEQRNAQFRYIYKISRNEFSRVKEVKFEGENNWIKRNEYAFKKR